MNIKTKSKFCFHYIHHHVSPVKRICVFDHSVMTNFNYACPAIQSGQGSGFLSEGSSWLTACIEQRRFWRDCADVQARLNIRCSHRRLVPNSLDAVHVVIALYSNKGRVSAKTNQSTTKPTKSHERPAKTRISLDTRPVWSAFRRFVSLSTHKAHSEDSDKCGRIPRLISLRLAHSHVLDFVMLRPNCKHAHHFWNV